MKKITVLSLFPQMIAEALSYGVIKRTELDMQFLNLRDWGEGEFKRVDGKSVSPGPGMLLRADIARLQPQTLA